MAEAPIMILNIVRDARHFPGEVSSLWANRECVCVCGCLCFTNTHPYTVTFLHSYIPTVCVYIYMMVSSTVSASATHIYSESERKYVSVMYVLGIVYSINMNSGLSGNYVQWIFLCWFHMHTPPQAN